jgi:hypothetical protein
LSPQTLDRLGKEVGFLKRQRTLQPSKLVTGLLAGLSQGNVRCLSDLHRWVVRETGTDMGYRSFHDRLNSEEFPILMCATFIHAANHLVLQALRFSSSSPFNRFHSVHIQDGSSFALHKSLAEVFPGRFNKVSPAAVELHATFDLLANTCESVTVAPDVNSERAYLPAPGSLSGYLLLADRGYPSFAILAELDKAGAGFVMRAKENLASKVVGVYQNGELCDLEHPVALHAFLKQHAGEALDLVVQVVVCEQVKHFRVVGFPKKKGHTILLTNLPHESFSAELVGLAYRLRWQVELLFKEWKSHANLKRFVTRQAPIAVGLIWASLLVSLLNRFMATAAQIVGKVAISTLKAAKMMAAHLPRLFQALLTSTDELERVFEGVLDDLIRQAKRAHPARDRRKGREQSGLRPVFQG